MLLGQHEGTGKEEIKWQTQKPAGSRDRSSGGRDEGSTVSHASDGLKGQAFLGFHDGVLDTAYFYDPRNWKLTLRMGLLIHETIKTLATVRTTGQPSWVALIITQTFP